MDEIKTCVPIGHAIRHRRESLGLSRKELSKKIGMSEEDLLNFEIDGEDLLVGMLIKIAEALDTSAYKLVKLAEKHSFEINPNENDGPGSEEWLVDDTYF